MGMNSVIYVISMKLNWSSNEGAGMIKSIRFFLISWSDHWAHAHCRSDLLPSQCQSVCIFLVLVSFLVIFLSHAKIFKRMAAMPCSAFTYQRLCTGNPSKVVNCNSPLLTSPTVQIIAAEITRIFQAAAVYNSVLPRMDTTCQSSLNGFCDRMISLPTSPAKFPILLTKTPCKWLPTFDASLIPGRRSRVTQEAQPHKWLPSFYTPHMLVYGQQFVDSNIQF